MLQVAIVDDNRDMAELVEGHVKEILKEETVQCNIFVTASNFISGLEENESYHIYLLDIDIPEITGEKEFWVQLF